MKLRPPRDVGRCGLGIEAFSRSTGTFVAPDGYFSLASSSGKAPGGFFLKSAILGSSRVVRSLFRGAGCRLGLCRFDGLRFAGAGTAEGGQGDATSGIAGIAGESEPGEAPPGFPLAYFRGAGDSPRSAAS